MGALLLAGLIWFILRRRRRTTSEETHQHQSGCEKPELEGRDGRTRKDHNLPLVGSENGGYPPGELYSKQVQEMEGSSAGYELPAKGTR